MHLLLDTHALLWWLAGDMQLSIAARGAIGEPANAVYVSAASAWEITTKHRLGKLPGMAAVAASIEGAVSRQGFLPLPVSMKHGEMAGSLPGPHRDPFDRMLIAQAMAEGLTLVSNEAVFGTYPIARLW